jgi:tetratricopeptide (TPR) repeat protein
MTAKTKNRGRSLPILFLVFISLALVLLITRVVLFRKPPPVADTAPIKEKLQYWHARIAKDVSDKEAYLNLGLLEEKAGFYLSAERNLTSARALGVPDSQVSGPLGRALTHLSKVDEAKIELEKAVALAPMQWEPVANLAGFYADNRNTVQSTELITNFWKTVPRSSLSPEDLERLFIAFNEAHDTNQSHEVAQHLAKQHPNYANGLALIARSAFATGDIPAAKTYTEQALKIAPNDSVVLYFYGIVLQKLKDYDGALQAWQKANAITPKALDIRERIGEEYVRRGDFKQAAIAFEYVAIANQQLSSAINTAEAYDSAKLPEDAAYWKAIAYGLQGQFAQSLAMSQRAAQSFDPRRKHQALIAIAEAYKGMEKKPEYLAALLSATQSGSVDDLLQRARAYDFLDQPQKQEEYLRLAIQKDPKRESGIRYDIGKLLSGTGKKDEGEKELEKAIELEPKNTIFKITLAEEYLLRSSTDNKLDKATQLVEQSIALDNQNDKAWLILGQCYAVKNMLPQAVQAIEHTIDLEPGNGPAYLEIGRVYARMGNTRKSQESMKMYQQYVTFEQEKQTLKTKARRNGATATEITAYADLLGRAGYANEALKQYKIAYSLDSKNIALKNKIDAYSQNIKSRNGN